jgi:hypothetical protein
MDLILDSYFGLSLIGNASRDEGRCGCNHATTEPGRGGSVRIGIPWITGMITPELQKPLDVLVCPMRYHSAEVRFRVVSRRDPSDPYPY